MTVELDLRIDIENRIEINKANVEVTLETMNAEASLNNNKSQSRSRGVIKSY